MSDHYGIGELSAAYRTGALQPAAWLRDHRTALQALAAEGDNAWIMVASEAQLEAQLTVLAGMNAAQCPLYGIPFAIKDNIDMADWTTTAACPPFAYRASSTARCVELLLKAGAILMGKTNLDQFATGLVGTRSPFGAVANAFSPKHISGGSSSGSAVVVARGQVAFALGTDTAGSGRVPAMANGIVGLKPSLGLVPTKGVGFAVMGVKMMSHDSKNWPNPREVVLKTACICARSA
jgi:allophanate hydrolase